MGYKSRIYIVHEQPNGYVWKCGKRSAEIIATFNLCCCEQKVLNAFTDTAECCLIIDDTEVVEDCYGEALKSTDLMTLYNAIERGEYWRTSALKEFLHGIMRCKFGDKDILTREFEGLKAYHFGY